MDRRNFLQLAALAVAGQAAERVFPFRVYSIPKKIMVVSTAPFLGGIFTARPALFGGTMTSVQEEAMQQYANAHMTAAMREFNQKLMEARSRLFHSGRFYIYDELLAPTALPTVFP